MATIDSGKRANGHRIECSCPFCKRSDAKTAELAAKAAADAKAAMAASPVAGPVIFDAGCDAGTCAHLDCADERRVAATFGTTSPVAALVAGSAVIEPGPVGAALVAAAKAATVKPVAGSKRPMPGAGCGLTLAGGGHVHVPGCYLTAGVQPVASAVASSPAAGVVPAPVAAVRETKMATVEAVGPVAVGDGSRVVATVGTRGAWHFLAGVQPVTGACGWSGAGMVAVAPNGADARAAVCYGCRKVGAANGWSTAGRNAAMHSMTLAGEGPDDVTIDAGQPVKVAKAPVVKAAAPVKPVAPVVSSPVAATAAPVAASTVPAGPVAGELTPAASAALAAMREYLTDSALRLPEVVKLFTDEGEYGAKAIEAAAGVLVAEHTAELKAIEAAEAAAKAEAARVSVIPVATVNPGPVAALPAGMTRETAALVAQAAASLAAASEQMARTGALLLAAIGITSVDPAAASSADLAARLRVAGLPATPGVLDSLAATLAPVGTRPVAPVATPVEYTGPVVSSPAAASPAAPVASPAAREGSAEGETAARSAGAAYAAANPGADPVAVAVAVARTQTTRRLQNIAATAALTAIGGPAAVKTHWPAFAEALKATKAPVAATV